MFKPQKPQQNQPPGRQRLPLVERPPKQEDIATLFTGALRVRGCMFEMPIRPSPQSATFLLACQFDQTVNDTVWTMYEGDAGNLQLWTCPQSDLDLVFDMVCMSCQPQNVTGTQLPPEVQAQGAVSSGVPYAPAPGQPVSPVPYNAYQQGYVSPQPQQQYAPQPQYPPPHPQAYPPSQPYPPAQQPYTPTGTPYPQPYPPSPVSQPQAAPQHQPPYPVQQPLPYTPSPQPFPAQGYSPQPQVGPAPPDYQAPGSGGGSPGVPDVSNFIDLLSKGQPNLLLGHLFVEAGMIPQPCLDAALKCQELVRKGKLTNEQAIRALRRAAELGGVLDEDVLAWARDPDAARARSSARVPPPQSPTAREKDNTVMLKILELLKQAGLVSEADLETAKKVRSKHGGDLGQILVAAGKIGQKTLEGACQCQEYVTNGRMRIDKAIMALHYCERMRTGLKDALQELGIEVS